MEAEEADDQFVVIEADDADEPARLDAYPLTAILDAFSSLYGYITSFLIVFTLWAWLGMVLGGTGYHEPARAISDMFTILFVMLIVPAFRPFLIIAIGRFFVPLRSDSRDMKALALIVLLTSSVAAYGAFTDIFNVY